jgi:uncharacterized membrane protein
MESLRRLSWILVFTVCFVLLSLPIARAYVDPGTGSYVFQLLIGALLGATVAVKIFWKRIWGFITRRTSRSATAEPAPDTTSPPEPRD